MSGYVVRFGNPTQGTEEESGYFENTHDAVLHGYGLIERIQRQFSPRLRWMNMKEVVRFGDDIVIAVGKMHHILLPFYVVIREVDVPVGTGFTSPIPPDYVNSKNRKTINVLSAQIKMDHFRNGAKAV